MASLVMVGVLWGCTNPLMKKGGVKIKAVKKDNMVAQFAAEMYALLLSSGYVIAFLINMSGSVLYYYTLSSTDISIATPIANTLTFLFTMLMSIYLGEQKSLNWQTVVGCGFVVAGVAVCLSA